MSDANDHDGCGLVENQMENSAEQRQLTTPTTKAMPAAERIQRPIAHHGTVLQHVNRLLEFQRLAHSNPVSLGLE